jgi:hypothetical protein
MTRATIASSFAAAASSCATPLISLVETFFPNLVLNPEDGLILGVLEVRPLLLYSESKPLLLGCSEDHVDHGTCVQALAPHLRGGSQQGGAYNIIVFQKYPAEEKLRNKLAVYASAHQFA